MFPVAGRVVLYTELASRPKWIVAVAHCQLHIALSSVIAAGGHLTLETAIHCAVVSGAPIWTQ
jgi:hypothetical protein